MIGAVTEVTQDPEKAGSAMKILSLRLRGMKGQLEELGEETDENVENISKMQGQILNMTHGKVNIFDDNGEFRSTYEIMQGIAEVWNDLNSIDQANLLETIAGKNRANDVAALIENWENAAAMQESAMNSAGSAAKENARTVESLQGRINALKATWQAFANTFMESDFLKGLVSAATKFLDVITKIVDVGGTLPVIFGAIAAGLSFKNIGFFKAVEDEARASGKKIQFALGDAVKSITSKQTFSFGNDFAKTLTANQTALRNYAADIRSGLTPQQAFNRNVKGMDESCQKAANSIKTVADASGKNLAKSMRTMTTEMKSSQLALDYQSKTLTNTNKLINTFNTGTKAVGLTQGEFLNTLSQSNPVLASYLAKVGAGNATLLGYMAAAGGAEMAQLGLNAAMMVGNMVMSMALMYAISGVIKLFDKLHVSAEETAEKVEEISSAFEESKSSLKDAKSTIAEVSESYAKLSKGVNQITGENMSLSTAEYEEYLSISNQIADTFPSLVQGYDEQGNAILNCAGSVEALTEAYKNLAVEAYNAVLKEDDTIFDDFNADRGKIENSANTRAMKAISEIMSSSDIDATLAKYSQDAELMIELSNMLEKEGFERDYGIWGQTWDNETYADFVKRVVTEEKNAASAIVSSWDSNMESAVTEMKQLAESYIGKALVNGDYSNLSDSMQSIINGAVSNMDYDFFVDANGESKYKDPNDLYADLNKMMSTLNSMSAEQQKSIEVAMELKTRYNNGEISVADYIDGIENVDGALAGLDPDMREMIEITLGLDIKDVEADKNALKTKLVEELEMASDTAEGFIGTLSSGELKILYDLVLEGKIDKSMIDEFEALVDEMKEKGFELEDAMRTTFGNIDLGEDRGILEWTDKTIAQYDEALKSWGFTEDRIKDMVGGHSTVLGGTTSIGEIEVAFSPMLQTENGLELLDKNTVDEYFNGLLDKALENDGKVDAAELLSLDMTGLEINGKRIRNLIAGIGTEAERVSQLMHYAGADGALEATELWQQVRRELEVMTALNYSIDITAEVEGFEALNTALSESMSTTGLTAESMSALQSRYSAVEVAGRSLNEVFDATAVGLRLNTDVLYEFEQALASQKLEETTDQLSVLDDELARVEATIADANATASDRSAAITRRDDIIEQMNLLGKQAAMYEGLASKYAAWQNAEEAGNNRDMYEAIIEGRENIKDELSRGWADDGTVKYLEMMTDRTDLAGKSAKELRGIFNDLDNAVNSSGISINDWFTVDDEGNSTAKGFYNFLDTINAEAGAVGDAVTKHSDGSYTFDFEVAGGDEAIAEALGVSEEIVHIMLQAGKDAGFEINFEGQFEHFSNIVSSAKEALNRFNKSTDSAFDFDFSSSDIQTVTTDLAEAQKLLEQYKVDGKLNLDSQDAKDAWEMVSTLQTSYDRLTDPAYMSLDASSVEEELKEPLEKLQEYDMLLAEKSQLELKGEVDTDTYKKNADSMKETFEYFKQIRDDGGDLAKQLKIEGLSDEELQSKLDNQELSLPTELDLTASIDDSLSKMLDLAQYEAGLKEAIEIPWIFEEQTGAKIDGIDFEAYGDKKQIAIDFVTDNQELLNTLNATQRKITVDFYMENQDFLKAYTKDQQKIGIEFIATNPEVIEGYDNAQKQIVFDFVVNNPELLDEYDDAQKKIFFDYVVKNPDVLDAYEGDKKQVVVDFIVNNPEVLAKYEDPIHQKIILDYVAENGIEAWNELGEEGQAEYIEKQVNVKIEAGVIDASDVETKTEDAVENAGGGTETVETTANVDVNAGEVDTSDVENKVDESVENAGGEAQSTEVTTDIDVKADEVDTSDVDSKIDTAVGASGGEADTTEATTDVELKANEVDISDVADKTKEAIESVSGEKTDVEKSIDLELKISEYNELIQNLEDADKDIVIDVTVNGLDQIQELNKNIDLATNIDGDIDNLSEFVEAAKSLDGISDNIVNTVTVDLYGNLDANKNLDSLQDFIEGAKGLEGVQSSFVTVNANIESNLNNNSGNIDQLTEFAEGAKALQGIPSSSVNVVANLDANIGGILGYNADLNNLDKFADAADRLSGIKGSEVSVTANLDANTGGILGYNADLNNLDKFADAAERLSGIEGSEVSVVANLDANTGGILGYNADLNNLDKFAEGAEKLSTIKGSEVNVIANLDANTGGILGYNADLNNLDKFADAAEKLSGIKGSEVTVKATLDANTGGFLGVNPDLDNLDKFADAADKLDDIEGSDVEVTATLTADFDTEDIDKLPSFVDGANKLQDVSDVEVNVTANLDGEINADAASNLSAFAEGAQKLQGASDVETNVTASLTTEGIGGLAGFNPALNNLNTFAESANNLKDVGDVKASITASLNTDGIGGLAGFNPALNNLNEFAEGAKNIKGVGNVKANVEANLSGNGIGGLAGFNPTLSNLNEFAEGAKSLKDVGDVKASVTASLNADDIGGIAGFNPALNNLSAFADGANRLKDIGEVKASVEANISGNIGGTLGYNSTLSNLDAFADGANRLQGVSDKTVNVEANLNGNIGESSSAMSNLPAFTSAASSLQGVGSKEVVIDATINGNINSTNVGTLSQFGAVVSGLPSSATVNVDANVDIAAIQSAQTTLQGLSSSGVMHDYNANVTVNAKVNSAAVDNYQPAPKTGQVSYSVDPASSVYTWVAPPKTGDITYTPHIEALTEGQKHKTGTITYTASIVGLGPAAGTAHSGGTASSGSASGRAFACGDWGIKGSGVALGGELGQELVRL